MQSIFNNPFPLFIESPLGVRGFFNYSKNMARLNNNQGQTKKVHQNASQSSFSHLQNSLW